MSNLPLDIKQYLNDRGITDDVIEQCSIKWLNNKIVLPVYDVEGKVLFNKYRRSPQIVDNSVPKYSYDKGSKATLFNANNVNFKSSVWITEGELDALRLMSSGIQAVSTTGGSGTFIEEWAEYFKDTPEVFVCYDRDEAGIRGMIRVQKVLPQAKLVFLPEFKGKDITDYLLKNPIDKLVTLSSKAKSWYIPPVNKTSKAVQRTNYNRLANEALEYQREIKSDFYTRHIIDEIYFYRDELDKQKKKTVNIDESLTDLANAKAVPIANYLKFNSQGFAHCIWHKEKTPSLKYYPDKNKVYCYGGCAKSADTIDVVMALHNCSLKEAIKIILNK